MAGTAPVVFGSPLASRKTLGGVMHSAAPRYVNGSAAHSNDERRRGSGTSVPEEVVDLTLGDYGSRWEAIEVPKDSKPTGPQSSLTALVQQKSQEIDWLRNALQEAHASLHVQRQAWTRERGEMQRKLETSREKLRIARSGSISTTNLRAGEGPGGGGVEGGAGGDVEDALRDALCLKTRELEDVKAQLVALRHRDEGLRSPRTFRPMILSDPFADGRSEDADAVRNGRIERLRRSVSETVHNQQASPSNIMTTASTTPRDGKLPLDEEHRLRMAAEASLIAWIEYAGEKEAEVKELKGKMERFGLGSQSGSKKRKGGA